MSPKQGMFRPNLPPKGTCPVTEAQLVGSWSTDQRDAWYWDLIFERIAVFVTNASSPGVESLVPRIMDDQLVVKDFTPPSAGDRPFKG
jgi:hypothetical protein